MLGLSMLSHRGWAARTRPLIRILESTDNGAVLEPGRRIERSRLTQCAPQLDPGTLDEDAPKLRRKGRRWQRDSEGSGSLTRRISS